MDIEGTLSERGDRYGDFTHHADIAQDLQNTMRKVEGWAHLDAVKKQALTVIADKIARILSGDPEYADNWHDIQGYARLVEERLPQLEMNFRATEKFETGKKILDRADEYTLRSGAVRGERA